MERMALENTSCATYDRRSFVGLSLRLPLSVTCEVYATGRVNVPGATSYDVLFQEFAVACDMISRYRR